MSSSECVCVREWRACSRRSWRQAHKTEVALGGTTSLRALKDEVDHLLNRLSEYRPLKPLDMDVDYVLTKRADAMAAEAAEAIDAALRFEIAAAGLGAS